MHDFAGASIEIRQARTTDVPAIKRLIDLYVPDRRLLSKPTVTLYEDIQEFQVAVQAHEVVGCGALHVLWRDLAEIRTVAVDPALKGFGIGHHIVAGLIDTARTLDIRRIFVLTFEVDFFARQGFVTIDDTPLNPEARTEMLHSRDEGMAEFLELERVKPNTLGNTRMLLWV